MYSHQSLRTSADTEWQCTRKGVSRSPPKSPCCAKQYSQRRLQSWETFRHMDFTGPPLPEAAAGKHPLRHRHSVHQRPGPSAGPAAGGRSDFRPALPAHPGGNAARSTEQDASVPPGHPSRTGSGTAQCAPADHGQIGGHFNTTPLIGGPLWTTEPFTPWASAPGTRNC